MEEKIDAGRVAARPGKASNETKFHRVFADEEKTIGIVFVTAFAANAAAVVAGVAITATRRRTRSATSDGRRSYRPSSQ